MHTQRKSVRCQHSQTRTANQHFIQKEATFSHLQVYIFTHRRKTSIAVLSFKPSVMEKTLPVFLKQVPGFSSSTYHFFFPISIRNIQNASLKWSKKVDEIPSIASSGCCKKVLIFCYLVKINVRPLFLFVGR